MTLKTNSICSLLGQLSFLIEGQAFFLLYKSSLKEPPGKESLFSFGGVESKNAAL